MSCAVTQNKKPLLPTGNRYRARKGSNDKIKAIVRIVRGDSPQEMTLDCFIFRCSLQSRVISVLSYYLTSLVNLSFYRLDFAFSDPIDFGIFSILHIICVFLILHTEISSLIRALSPALTRYIFLRTSFLIFSYFGFTLSSLMLLPALTFFRVSSLLLSLYPFRYVHIALSLGFLPVHWYHLLCL